MIAIIDYGIGGLGFYTAVQDKFPGTPIIYFSDSGFTPYGKLRKQELRQRLEKVFRYLFGLGAQKIIVACHAASSVVRESDTNVVGLRIPTVDAVVNSRRKRVGILGGGRTIRSGYYRRSLERNGIETRQRIAQPLSILIEKGETDSPQVHREVKRIVGPLRSCDSILLACTHYPVLADVIRAYIPADVVLIDPVDQLLASVRADLSKFRQGRGTTVFTTTGNVSLMKHAAKKAFGVTISAARRVVLKT